jgi:hypothetical protein
VGLQPTGLTRGGDGDQGLGSGFEQQVIDDRLILIGDVGDRGRQGEDDMEVGHGQEFGLAVGQPLLSRGGLALRAMPVAAGIVGDAQVRALLSVRRDRPTPRFGSARSPT